MSKPTIHQLLHTLSYGDAISGEAIALQRCLQQMGFESEIYAINVHPKLKSSAKFFHELPSSYSGAIILHYSIGSPLNDAYKNLYKAKRYLVYHNLTPASWFKSVNPRIVSDIERGLIELPELCAVSDFLIADSNFNAGELKNLGFNSEVLPLPIDPSRWQLESDPQIASLLKNDDSLQIIHVGRMAPNKCLEDIIKVFYFIHHYIDKKSRLWLAGIDIDTEVYSYSLKRLVYQLHLDDAVNFVNTFTDEAIKALYENSDAYICMSEHEGFCLPVVEAMNFSLPVIAYASSALPDTISYGGILVKEKRYPEIAEIVYQVCTNNELRTQLITNGKKRVEDFSYNNFAKKVQDIFSKTSESHNLYDGDAVAAI
jgi:L-malate glycosyltransferase